MKFFCLALVDPLDTEVTKVTKSNLLLGSVHQNEVQLVNRDCFLMVLVASTMSYHGNEYSLEQLKP